MQGLPGVVAGTTGSKRFGRIDIERISGTAERAARAGHAAGAELFHRVLQKGRGAGEGAAAQRYYPRLFERMEERPFENGAFTLEMTGASITDPLIFVSHLDSLSCKTPPKATAS